MNSRLFFRVSLLAVAFWLVMPAVLLAAQGAAIAVVEYTSSDDIIIIRNGRRLAFADSFGLELISGDQVQTGRAVAMEIRFIRNNALVKITENTTFIIEAPSAGDTGLRLVYGRVRAKVERLTGTETFSVQSSAAVAGVRGTDFGYDLIAVRNTAVPASRIYCFEGVVEVTALVRTPATMADNLEPLIKRFVLDSGSMVEVQAAGSATETVKTIIPAEVRSFWMQNDFKDAPGVPPAPEVSQSPAAQLLTGQQATQQATQPPGQAGQSAAQSTPVLPPAEVTPQTAAIPPAVQLLPTLVVETEYVYLPDLAYAAKLRQASNLKNGGILTGINLLAIGLGLNFYASQLNRNGDSASAVQYSLTGNFISAAALPFLVVAFLVKP